ncbi:MFS transporter [Aneurinibacillus migulanus]|uniref:Fosmidomycin resistance protein n=1 Tax=Aneurinibacillus migulanus TaxID=47500 RepID=A0A0D1UUI7_ANEMI|nr:MFS transporter [Aneurinibacillus migulanus]KIV50634.1 Fosmidomycin resistance protein [Aneurinibacillus migulanus]KON97446.1 Fosmidomycin resistance protein [Aneurinibacillus migulanus]MED0895702.1 MFS transporter [Aneurinibacillus migulanus]MED1619710.1 MFS transporter [Aneurinibacillus migulanus]SDK49142.1 MFS transporter, FSR family, fosmidomycin resistance protein [Aneurinibacillus migulanus]
MKSSTSQVTVYSILLSISLVHLLNDSIQSVIPAIFPILHESLKLSFTQIGWIAFTLNITASMFQPLIGLYTDAKPKPSLLPIGVVFSLLGMLVLAFSSNFWQVIISVILIGVGSSVLHPEASRVAYLAAGPRKGLAQSIFQTGGNIGQALAPVFTALIFVPLGQFGIIWFTIAALAAIIVQIYVARWYRYYISQQTPKKKTIILKANERSTSMITYSIGILIMLLFSKFVYMASMTGFYAFYLIDKHSVSTEHAQLFIFLLLVAGALGTFVGGPMADRFGRRNMIWFSILGTAPFSLLLPFANLFWSAVLCFFIGFILLSGFSVIIVYAQELLPGKIGTVSGLFFGLAFGLGGLGSVVLGTLADHTSISFIIQVCAYLPLIGLLAAFLPTDAVLRLQPATIEATTTQNT